jgi:hypothetical protein
MIILINFLSQLNYYMQQLCLPTTHIYLFIGIIVMINLIYLYVIRKNDFKLDLKNTLEYQSEQINKIFEDHQNRLNDAQMKRVLLEKRDISALKNDFKAPEKRLPEHQYPDRDVKKIINIPSRGSPDNYHSIGTLVRKSDEKVVQLFGRQKYPSSNQWEYYTTGNDSHQFPTKMPLITKGNREIEDKQEINLEWLDPTKGKFIVNLYEYDVPRYNPYDY